MDKWLLPVSLDWGWDRREEKNSQNEIKWAFLPSHATALRMIPKKRKIRRSMESPREGGSFANILPESSGGARTMRWEGQVLPGWEEGWTEFQSSTYFNCQETDLLCLSL